jgi:hypothetical protein
MAAEYLANAEQLVSLNSPINFEASIPCRKGYVIHENGTGIFILRGITDQCYATYQVTYNGNIALPEDATEVVPIAIAITVNGEPRLTSRAIYTPAAVDEFGNVTSTAIIRIPRGCCFTVAVEAVPATTDPTVTPAPVINTQNNNLVINRIA